MAFFRKTYRLDIKLKSPLAIGSGENVNTDSDVIVDNTGKPFIPASSLAGVLRNYVAQNSGIPTANAVFGFIPRTKDEAKKAKAKDRNYIERDCLVRVYDGLYAGGNDDFFITNRDMVALRDKVGIDGAKFDMQAVETGASFTAYIEVLQQGFEEDSDKPDLAFIIDIVKEIEAAISALAADRIRLGSKTSRGYGSVSVACKSMEFTEPQEWIDFDMMDANVWETASPVVLSQDHPFQLTLGLELQGGISIREYTTEPSTEKKTMPDYMQLSLHLLKEAGAPTPVIPGTSWAGAIRDRFLAFSGKKTMESLFGYVHQKLVDGDDDVMKSVISFSESILTGGIWKTTTRNAIDRFSGGTKDGALYTERTYYGGKTELVISFTKAPDEKQKKLLSACLADLHNGFLAVGGLTSVGRGLFRITSVNGSELPAEDQNEDRIFEVLNNALQSAAETNPAKEDEADA